MDVIATMIPPRYGGLDILVNNAAIAFKRAATEPFAVQAEQTVRVNYFQTKRACDLLFPLLRPGARAVNVSSIYGRLRTMVRDGTDLKARLAADDLTAEELDGIMEAFVAAAKEGRHEELGWANSAYVASKVGLSALTRVQHRRAERERPGQDIAINHIHPGMVQTGMSSGGGDRTPDQGAQSALFAATLPPGTDVRGKFVNEDATLLDWA